MRFDDRFLEEIKSRLRLSDVIGRTVKLRRQGREYVGLSPFSKEKTPSFFVNDDKGFFHDFSSGKHGDLISFLQESERLSFHEAVERMAGEAGVPLPALDAGAVQAEERRQGLSQWLDLAGKWFEAQLRRPDGASAREYLTRRALPETDRERFGVGYALAGRTALKDYLIAKGARPAELVDAGLLIAPEDGGAPYDRFRDRIMFPITDARGRIISFGGRALDPEARAKYLNGPETALFHKGATLYGLSEARKLLQTGGDGAPLVVVEGYMDAIACQRAKIAAVAPLGTALTEDQMAALWRLHPEPTVCLDADAAGKRAAHRVLDRALPLLQPGRTFRFAYLRAGKDPDEVMREKGAAVLKAEMSETRPFVGELFEREKLTLALDTPESYAGLKVRLRKLAGQIADKDLAGIYREALLDRFEELRRLSRPASTVSDAGRALQSFRRRGARRAPSLGGPSQETVAAVRRAKAAPAALPAALAQAVLDYPALLDDRLEAVSVQGFGDKQLAELAREMISMRIQADVLDPQALKSYLNIRGFGTKLDEIQWAAGRSHAPFLAPDHSFNEIRALWSRAFDALIRITALERAVADAKADLERGEDFTTFMSLKTERDALKRRIISGTYFDDQTSK